MSNTEAVNAPCAYHAPMFVEGCSTCGRISVEAAARELGQFRRAKFLAGALVVDLDGRVNLELIAELREALGWPTTPGVPSR